MEIINTLFGEGKDLSVLQMSCRTIVVFFVVLILIRVSGRRSFASKTALDNIIVILLGAILSRAVVGASPFLSTLASGFILAFLHRSFAWMCIHNPTIGQLVKGEYNILYESGHVIQKNLQKMLLSEKDLQEGVRAKANTESFERVSKIIMERDGGISIIEKE